MKQGWSHHWAFSNATTIKRNLESPRIKETFFRFKFKTRLSKPNCASTGWFVMQFIKEAYYKTTNWTSNDWERYRNSIHRNR